MNTEITVAIVLGAVIVGIAGFAVAIWRRMSADANRLRKSLLEAQKQAEVERALRQSEHADSESRALERDAALKAVMEATVANAIEKFKTASGEQLKTNGAEFAEFSKKSIAEILDPLKQRIKEYDERADKIHQGNTTLGTELKGYVQTILTSATQIQNESTGFRNELKFNNKFQGNFGEERLEIVLGRCGLVKDDDFVLQSGEDNKIPDCRLYDHLAKKIIVIDSKMSWKNYSDALATDDPQARESALDAHVVSVKGQIANLAKKKYNESLKADREGYAYVPFSIMFVPSDGALMAAIERDASLIQYAAEQNVYLTSPLNLYNLLKLIKTCLKNLDFAENLGKVAVEVRNVVDRIDAMFAEYEKLGDCLRSAGYLYEKIMKRMTDGSAENKSSILRSASEMIRLGAKHDKLKSKAMAEGLEKLAQVTEKGAFQ